MRVSVFAAFLVCGSGCDSAGTAERGSLAVLTGNADGSFVAGWTVPVHLPRAVAVADLDGDARAELAVARYDKVVATYAIDIGQFVLLDEYVVDEWPNKIAAVDVNGDGNQDLVVSCFGSVDVLLGTGDGRFSEPKKFQGGGENTTLAILDFNNDSHPDLAIARGASVVLLAGTPDGDFSEHQALALPVVIHDVEVADTNGDGRMDILATAMTVGLLVPDHGTLFVMLGEPTGFGPPAAYDLPNAGQELSVDDLDGDETPDALVTGGRSVAIALGRANGSFSPPIEHTVGTSARDALVSDFNADEMRDLAVAHTNGWVTVSLGSTSGVGAAQQYAAGNVPVSIVDADVNDDGRIDLIVVNEGGEGLP